MAGPGGREVGRVSVRVLPDTSSFARSLERYLNRVERTLRVDLPVSLEAGSVARTEAELDALTRDRKVEMKVDVDRRTLDGLGSAFGKIGGVGGGFGSVTKILGGLGPALAVAASLLPLLATAILAIPSALAAIAAPLAAIALGFEGIKRAAAGLAAPFAALQAVVSAVFEKGLTPVFRKLEKIFPTLAIGFSGIANAIVAFADAVVSKLTSAGGLAALGTAFSNIGAAMSALAPAMGPLTDSFLILLTEGSAAFARVAHELATLIVKFNEILTYLSESGTLTAAFNYLNTSLYLIIGAIGATILALTAIAAACFKAQQVWVAMASAVYGAVGRMAGSVVGLLRSVAGVISSVFVSAWSKAYSAFTTGISKIVTLARTIGGKIKSAVGDLSGLLVNAGKDIIRGLISGIGKMMKPLGDTLGRVSGFIKDHKGPPSYDKVMLTPAGESIIDGLINGFENRYGAAKSSLDRFTNSLASTSFSAAGVGSMLGDGRSAASGGMIFNITAPRELDEPEVARFVANRVLWRMSS